MIRSRQSLTASKQGRRTLVPVLPLRDTVHFPALINTLHVVRDASMRAVRRSLDGDGKVLVLSQRDMAMEDPSPSDLVRIGTLSETLQAVPLPDASLRVALRGIHRVRAVRIVARGGAFWAEIEDLAETETSSPEIEATIRMAIESFGRIIELNKSIPAEAMQSVVHLASAGAVADAIAHHMPLRASQKQDLLESLDADVRLQKILSLLKREEQVLAFNADIHRRVERELGETQREYYLREQMRIIQEELQLREDRLGETEEYRRRILDLAMPPQAEEHALSELRRLDRTPAASPEGMVLRNYLDTLIALPWNVVSDDQINVRSAAKTLDARHFGLSRVKERVLDHLAVMQLNPALRGPILCFVGPPGVGKTSIGKAIAEAMGRKFVRVSLGGVRDEAEVRGHRRTYVGSMPGRIIQGLRQCGTRNPVFMLDEIDKISGDYRGDPTAALLEALDPEQNKQFSDHYVEVPFDLSGAIFIATANLLENIPPALRDRMEVIRFPSYTEDERLHIAREFLLPKSLREHGLAEGTVEILPEALELVAQDYTREAGVRDLDRVVASLIRKCGRRIAEGSAEAIRVDRSAVADLLGQPRYRRNSRHRSVPGVANGLVVSELGGDVVQIEASLMEPHGEKPQLTLTGNLGQVMRESAEAAVTYVRSHPAKLPVDRAFRFDVHVHVPEGAIPKDGPSAGITILAALLSAHSERSLPPGLALTGELTLRGRVLPVGGIRDKVIAATAAGFTDVVVPMANAADLDEISTAIREKIRIHLVDTVDELLPICFPVSSAVVAVTDVPSNSGTSR